MAHTAVIEYKFNEYTPAEELANSLTHGLGTLLSIAGLALLVTFAALNGNPWQIASVSIFGASLVLLYLTSTLYHSFRKPRLKHVFNVLDHAAIYILIAGSYTPFTLVNLRGPWGWTLFGIIWGLALAGVFFKLCLFGRFKILSLIIYIAMGWFVVIAIKPVLSSIPAAGIIWLILGGCAYTSGVIFYAWKKLPFNHAIWHLFVLTGSICHYFAVQFHVVS